MKCSNCGSNSAAQYTIAVGETERTVYVCPSCYEKLYKDPSRAAFFNSMFQENARRQSKACPYCKTSFADYRRTGLLGCAKCYEVFREELFPTISRLQQGNLHHEGQAPEKSAEENYGLMRELVREQDELKAALEQAIRRGDTDRADLLKERLIEINRKLYRV